MKTMKKYLAFMISLFMIAALWPATVYASVEEGDAAEEIWDAVEEAPMPELTEESVAEHIEAVSDEETSEVEAIIPDEPSGLIADEPSATEAEEIEEEVPENVGAGVQVGDGVTATFDPATGAVVFESSGGTLWTNWLSESGLQKNKIESIRSTGKLYLPSDSSYIFSEHRSLTTLDLSNFDTSKVTNMSGMFKGCRNLTNLDLSSFDTSNVTDMSQMFNLCYGLTNLDLSSFDTSTVTDMSRMFELCCNLTNLDLSSFNTSNVQNMSDMFWQCGLTSLDLSNFNTTNVRDMSSMFEGCCDLTNLDLSGFNTTNVTNMVCMFKDCISLTSLDLSSFDTSNVTSMGGMFWGNSLTNLDLSSFDTSNVTSMVSMFYDCNSLTNLDLSSFDTSNVTKMGHMFYECESLTNLDLSSFDTSKVSDFYNTFDGCTNLEILCTPKKHSTSGVALSLTMYDSAGKQYTELPVLSKSIVLGKTQKIAHEYAAKPISECTVTLKTTSYTYDGKTKKPAVTVKDGTKVLTSGTDYTVAYSKNKNAGEAVVTITATETGNYKGTKTANFTIKKADAGLAFAESSITKKSTDAPFTNPLTKATTAVATFTSDNESVATVDSATGKVTLKAAGTAIIIALANANANYNAGSTAYILTVEKPRNGFSDVQDPSHPFYNAIYWAAGAGITKGYPDGTFGIDRDCTRGEMIMFLWRFAGKPLPKAVWTSPFKDVPMSHSFFKAILWAYQTGITKGYSDGTFGINRNVSRGECMMFLWRIKGKPAPKSASKSPFKDVPTSHAFYKAILWGSQKGVTKGYTSGPKKGNFGINDNCLRGQIVTFLYRAKDL